MAFSRQLGVIGILSACFFVAVGCGDDEDKKAGQGDAGEGGEDGGGKAGTGGKAAGGSNNTSGNGGSAGSAMAGAAANDAGAGGELVSAGGGGGGGAPDPVGGMAGEGGSVTSGGAGAGGDGGGAGGGAGDGGGGPVASKSCANECEVTADCADATAPNPQVCDVATKRCGDQFGSCESHDDCVPWASGFIKKCATQAECDDVFGVCVEWQGTGYCANTPFEGLCFLPPGAVVSELTEFGVPDPSSVEVCRSFDGRCDAGECILGCSFFGTCEGSNNGDTCNTTTGLCECDAGSECKSGVCGADSHCVECVTGAHCAGNGGETTCVAGKCGCDSEVGCPNDTESATPVCE